MFGRKVKQTELTHDEQAVLTAFERIQQAMIDKDLDTLQRPALRDPPRRRGRGHSLLHGYARQRCGWKGHHISANMQALLERAAVVCDMNPGLMKYKVGAAVAAVRRAGSIQAIDAMNHFFLNHEMFVAGSTYWNMAYGQMPGDVQRDEEGMNNMRNLGQNMSYLMKAVNNGAAPETVNESSYLEEILRYKPSRL